ncbi:MAG: hypothetical protein WKG01_22895 [Kofleriaceae bacterium]
MKPVISAILLSTLTACTQEGPILDEPEAEASVEGSVASSEARGERLFAYAPESSPLDADMTRWQQRWWRWVMSIPYAENPMFDPTGEGCDVGQHDGVFFLATVVGGGTSQTTRSCTVPAHQPILIVPAGSLNDFPCPDPSFQPAPGQTMYAFLKAGAVESATATNLIQITLDGVALPGTLGYRATSPRTFTFTGDPSLTTTFDSCITGTPQLAVADGYATMLRGLTAGDHTLVIRATNFRGGDTTLTWNLRAR